jgi:hypothetical protein
MPGTPSSIADVTSTKILFEKSTLHIKDELTKLFPTLLAAGAEGMPQLFLKVDNENGQSLKSDTPLRVSISPINSSKLRSLVCCLAVRLLEDTMSLWVFLT